MRARADYDAATQLLRLTGSPRIDDGSTDLTADTIDYHRDTQAANATGNVKATYGQNLDRFLTGAATASSGPAPGLGGSGPTHVISTSAFLDQAHGQAIFRGQARLWQGANSVSAPIIELTRNPESLKAYAEPAATNAVDYGDRFDLRPAAPGDRLSRPQPSVGIHRRRPQSGL